jgi:hypothetical protein
MTGWLKIERKNEEPGLVVPHLPAKSLFTIPDGFFCLNKQIQNIIVITRFRNFIASRPSTSRRIFARQCFADPGCLSLIQGRKDSGSSSKNFGIFNPKKLFLSSRKNDLGCSFRIRFFPIKDPGSRGQKGTRSRIRNTDALER